MLVRIVKDWHFPNIMRQTPSSSGVWNGVEFTEDEVTECDLLVVLNAPVKDLKVKCREAWLMSQESPIELYRWHTSNFKYFDRVFTFWDKSMSENILHYQTSLPWHINKTYDELTAMKDVSISDKKDSVSWITSNASHKEGHVLRLEFIDYLKKNNFQFDLFGKGFDPIEDKFDGIFPYKYSIAVENYFCNDYWTEKIADCFLSFTMPIYSGAKNILDYFPEESMVLIDPEKKEESMKKIEHAVKNDLWRKNFEHIKKSRELILGKYQFFPNIADNIEKYKVAEKNRKTFKFTMRKDERNIFRTIAEKIRKGW